MGKDQARSFVVVLSEAFNGIPPFLCGQQMVRSSSLGLPIMMGRSDERFANKA